VKHFTFLLTILTAVYFCWVISSTQTRGKVIGHVKRHGFRLGGLVLVLSMLLIAAAFYKSFSII
jgi:hypothetical protein